MSSGDFVKFLLQLSVMLTAAVVFGRLAQRAKQPAVLGEMLGGILLGPTLLGLLMPGVFDWLFTSSSGAGLAREACLKLGMLLFLFIAGMEISAADIRQMGRKALLIGVIGTLIPIAAGVGLVYAVPREFWGEAVQGHFFAFALFIGMNLANSANPVLARILMDLGLLRGGIGTLCMAATVVDDLVNWVLFAFILSQVSSTGVHSEGVSLVSVGLDIALVFAAVGIIFGGGRWLGRHLLDDIEPQVPVGVVSLVILIVMAAGALTEALGIHAFLGAFIMGIALSGVSPGKAEAQKSIARLSVAFFAPLYFVSMGMTTNYVTHFDWQLVALILVVALASKLGGVALGIRAAGMRIDRTAWAIAFALNARGATGIILAGVGRASGLIDDRIFVAIVLMALVTSLLASPMMKFLLQGDERRVVVDRAAAAAE